MHYHTQSRADGRANEHSQNREFCLVNTCLQPKKHGHSPSCIPTQQSNSLRTASWPADDHSEAATSFCASAGAPSSVPTQGAFMAAAANLQTANPQTNVGSRWPGLVREPAQRAQLSRMAHKVSKLVLPGAHVHSSSSKPSSP